MSRGSRSARPGLKQLPRRGQASTALGLLEQPRRRQAAPGVHGVVLGRVLYRGALILAHARAGARLVRLRGQAGQGQIRTRFRLRLRGQG